jgi:molecular chaperone GrpE
MGSRHKGPHGKGAAAPEGGGTQSGSAAPEDAASATEPMLTEPAAVATAARVAELEAECATLRDRWLRAEANLANHRRRSARDLEEAERRARDGVLGEVVSLADDLERALDAAEADENRGSIERGVRLVHERVREILRSHRVEVIDPVGQPFDPHFAEALFEVASAEHAPGTVVAVVEKGYRVGERLLRAAKVTVARAPEPGAPGGPAERA